MKLPFDHVQRPLLRFFSASSKERIGFIGLGAMGAHQAANLLKKGYSVTVFDISSESVGKLVAKGASRAQTPKEIASQSDVIVTMLPSSDNVVNVYLGDNGLIHGINKKDLLFLDSSTIDPIISRSVSDNLASKNAILLDCPVSGGTLGAEAGTLTFMVGGSKENFQRAKPYLEAMGKNIVHCGDSGAGQIVKLCNNLILGISMLGVSEAMNLGVKLGVDKKVLASVINTSSGRCWSSETYNPCPGVLEGVPSSRGYTGGFQTNLMKKDIGLAVQAATSQNIPLPIGTFAFKSYEVLSKESYGNKDFSSYFELLQKLKPHILEKQVVELVSKETH